MPCSLSDNRMVPSAGVQDPQRLLWLDTQRTLKGTARPPRWSRESSSARRSRSPSLRCRRCSEAATRATIVRTHSPSSAALMRAGTSTTSRPSWR